QIVLCGPYRCPEQSAGYQHGAKKASRIELRSRGVNDAQRSLGRVLVHVRECFGIDHQRNANRALDLRHNGLMCGEEDSHAASSSRTKNRVQQCETKRNGEQTASARHLAIASRQRFSSIVRAEPLSFYEESKQKEQVKSTLYNPHLCGCQRKC